MSHPTSCALASALLFAASVAAQLPPCFESSLGTNLGLGDDAVASGQSLGFTFPFGGATTTVISVSSNGFVWLGNNTDNGCCNGEVAGFLSGMGRVAAAWCDLDPSSAGGVYLARFTNRAVVTWDGVPEFGKSNSITMQVQLLADGTIYMFWGSPTEIASHSALVGVTRGGNQPSPRAIDFSAALPFNSGTSNTVYQLLGPGSFDLGGVAIVFSPNGQGGYNITRRSDCRFSSFSPFGTGCPAALPVALSASAGTRPAIGTNFDMLIAEAPNGSLVGAMLYGAMANVSLTPIGMTACTLYSTGALALPFPILGRYSIATLAIPNNSALVGSRTAVQAAVVAPGANPLGVVASNGADMEIGA